MLCKNCGNESATNDFCSVCGASMDAPAVKKSGAPKIFGIISLILGLFTLLLGVGCCIFYPSYILLYPLGITGLALAIVGLVKAKKQGDKNALAVVGLICSIAGMLCPALFWIIAVVFGLGASILVNVPVVG